MASQREVQSPRFVIRLSDEESVYGYTAIANRQDIMESAAQLLAALGDRLNTEYRQSQRQVIPWSPQQDIIVAKLKHIYDTVETVLEYIEQSAKDVMKNVKKQETVLRGIFNLTGK